MATNVEREIDIMVACAEVDFVKAGLQKARTFIDEIHHQLYERAVQIADYIGVKPTKPRTCRQIENRECLTLHLQSGKLTTY